MLTAELSRTRRLGVEYEFAIPQIGTGEAADVRRILSDIFNQNGVSASARGYSSQPVPAGRDVCIEYDSSVRGESRYRGIRWQQIEMKTRVLRGMDDWEAVVPKALAIAKYLGARVNSSCGHHVHVELAEATHDPVVIRSLYNTVHRYEPLIFGLVAPSRLRSSYSMPLPDRPGHLAQCRSLACFRRSLGSLSRQHGINWTHLWSAEPRIEYRYHGGTLDVEKARHWARFLLRMTDHACMRRCKAAKSQYGNSRLNLDKMMTTLGLKVNSRVYAKVAPELRETAQYLRKRWKSLNAPEDSVNPSLV